MRSPTTTRLLEAFHIVRNQTESLAAPLSPEDQTAQSMPDTSPTKWHRAHTTWFFETFVLDRFVPSYRPFDPDFNYLFNSYYDAIGDRHPRAQRGMVTRPTATEVGDYRRVVDIAVAELIESIESEDEEAQLAEVIQLGLHHEQQHQELLLMDIKHLLSLNPTEPAYAAEPKIESRDPGPLEWVEFAATTSAIGLAPDEGFAFDNEHPRHDQLIRPFALADRLITAGEWLDFMADDGYHRPDLWLSDGWQTRGAQEWEAPLYWKTSSSGWELHTLTGTRPVDPNEPVCHVSFYEADAYARWANARLATEFEWEHAAQVTDSSPASREVHLHPGVTSSNSSTVELKQMFGECWQWTESAYRPYPGYTAPPGAIGEYNGKFMINTMVLRGSSAFTPDGHARVSYRNFFHPGTRWHLSGVRLAKDLNEQ
ncbi:MAG: ergothioneine biosynthesis protein EgtB [Acidimicrobiales bacterium]|nr:ergothioneine biosynthesis protein EgtB [Acidimicrobiales bacterium]